MNQYKHIIIPDSVKQTFNFTPKNKGRGNSNIPERDRKSHAEYLKRKFDEVRLANDNVRKQMAAISLPTRNGTYIEFASKPSFELMAKSLENSKSGIRLLNIRQIITEKNEEQVFATIYVPSGKEKSFLNKLDQYATKEKNGKPKNDALFRSIDDIRMALLWALWTDAKEFFPKKQNDWYEIWIRIEDGNAEKIRNQHKQFTNTLDSLGITFKKDSILTFPERSVFLINANNDLLVKLLACSDQLAELRSGRVLAGFLLDEYRGEQQEWIEDLHNRVQINADTNSVVCVLDSGVNNKHPLLSPLIPTQNCGTVVGEGSADRHGHGTEMCGTIIYGDLASHIANNQKIQIDSHVGSIKIYPHNKSNPKEVWGYLTEQAVSTSEIIFPKRNICYCMAITAEDCEQGKPTSWSGAIDLIAYNNGEKGRLFMISAGNIADINNLDKEIISNYPKSNSLRQIQNPAQAWNSLTVGAFTNIVAINSPDLKGYDRVAPCGGISPFSRTSVLWGKGALIKPEVMFEGGNLYKTNDSQIPFSSHQDLALITTNKNYQMSNYFSVINATSASTALASHFAGKLQSRYPHLWAESIRGLIVHSAKWTSCMEKQFPVKNRGDMEQRLRHCGYGVPSEERALFSTENGLTYIAQETIQPFIKTQKDTTPRINEMHLFELPWPKETLEQLAEINVTMKVTLSYFIEPAPGEIGWKDKYRYASCGLRFDVNQEGEDKRGFQLRINKAIEAEENEERGKNDPSRWLIGPDNRNKGSIHSDELTLTAAQLAECNMIAVYPIGGWWKTRTNLKRYNSHLRYSLIVSLDTPKIDVNLYTAVKAKIETIINTPISIEIPAEE